MIVHEEFVDLWHGVPIFAHTHGEKIRLEVPLIRYGAVVAFPRGTSDKSLRNLVAMQRDEALRRMPTPQEDEWIRAKSVIDPLDRSLHRFGRHAIIPFNQAC